MKRKKNRNVGPEFGAAVAMRNQAGEVIMLRTPTADEMREMHDTLVKAGNSVLEKIMPGEHPLSHAGFLHDVCLLICVASAAFVARWLTDPESRELQIKRVAKEFERLMRESLETADAAAERALQKDASAGGTDAS